MLNIDPDTLCIRVSDLNSLPDMVYVLHAGSFGQLLRNLWLVPGSSNTILGSRFCQSQEDMADALGCEVSEIGSSCSETTSVKMAEAAFAHGRKLAAKRHLASAPIIGVGITSVVCTSSSPPEGKIECANLAIKTEDGVRHVFLRLRHENPDASMEDRIRHREIQGELVDLVALNMIFYAACVEQVPLDPWLTFMESHQFVRNGVGNTIVVSKIL